MFVFFFCAAGQPIKSEENEIGILMLSFKSDIVTLFTLPNSNLMKCSFFMISGDTCSGQCCDNKTEDELLLKSTQNFERIIQHHTNSHRGFWESTAKVFRGE